MKNFLLTVAVIVSAVAIGAALWFEIPVYVTMLLVAIVALGFIFYINILPHILEARQTIGVSQVADALAQDGKPVSAFWARLMGFKTQLAIFGGVMSEAVPQIVYKLEGYDMTNALGPKTGSIASITLMGLAAYFHATGLNKAANSAPADTSGSS